MCAIDIVPGYFFLARNGSILAVERKGGSRTKMTATVVHSAERKFPIGTQVTIQNEMGHVLCKGEGHLKPGETCKLHPLDAVDGLGAAAWSVSEKFYQAIDRAAAAAAAVAREAREALRRRRYNISRANRALIPL